MKIISFYIQIICVFLLLQTTNNKDVNAQKENFKILEDWVEWSNPENMLQLYLNKQAYNLLDKRTDAITQLKTAQDWQSRQQKVKDILKNIVGPFPVKTPLNPKVTGIIYGEGFRVEKILYESIPGLYVTGCLFIPNRIIGKHPAILNVSGHSAQSFRRDFYQNVILNLVKKGFIVLSIDPIGQGERLQYFNPQEKTSVLFGSPIKSSVEEHSYVTNQCLLTGNSLIKYFIWDGIRGIDYLLSREEVDPERIGLTGLSGGGTQTAFIGAFDERIVAAAPSCYITSYKRLLESVGTQDGEQNLYHGLEMGVDHADLIEVRMPKPTLIVSTTRDFFSIQGTRETFEEVSNAYKIFGKEENIKMSEADYEHGFMQKNNEATYAFFQKELKLPGSATEEKVKIFPENELNVTPTGQLSTSYKGKTVFDFNKSEADSLIKRIEQSRRNSSSHLEIVKQKAIKLSGYMKPKSSINFVFRGSYQRDGYSVKMYALETDEDYVIPLLIAIPDGEGEHPPVIYIHPDGKEEGIAVGGPVEKLVKQGFIVAAPDLLGIGETSSLRDYPGSHGYEAQLIGRSIVGIQTADIINVANFLKGIPNVKADFMQAVAFGELCPALLHAIAFDPIIKGAVFIQAPVSYYNIMQSKLYDYSLSFNWGVAGALTAYDLPDLVACAAPKRLTFVGMSNGQKKPASEELIIDQMAYPRSVYDKSNPGNLNMIRTTGNEIGQLLIDCLMK
ncbi:xylan esterase [Mariniphaga sediminis]|uniref:Xylan esterase n=1 Tax=Mariniphaga sediminis TaxID=1628158 RepID=A0A399CXP7_9BACT|nr:acetylxylan esterase [Mariniphaga sediminis]RIH62840.1 xylan esterase [Mariniphaga sediminis]